MTPPAAKAKSRLVTLLAWALMIGGALLTPISAISLLMLVAGSYGSQSATLSGFFVVVVLPPATLLAGFGLWRRSRLAHLCVLLLLGGVAAWNAGKLLRGPTEAHTVHSADGVPTHVSGSEVDYPMHVVVALAALGALVLLLRPSVRAEFPGRTTPVRSADAGPREPVPAATPRSPDDRPDAVARGWRVGHRGRDEMYYEELREGRWERIPISGEMLMGRAHHVIYFASPREWLAYPDWARHRRAEIVARVKSEFRPPDYEYVEDGPAPMAPFATGAGSTTSPSQLRALAIAVTLLLAIAAGAGWLVQRGVARGETWLPLPHASQRRVVARAEEPATFWLAIAVYAATAAGTAGMSGWLALEGARLRRTARADH